jgi:hypothetical protein
VLRDAYVSRLGLTLDELPRWRTRVRLASLDQGALGDVEHVLDRLRLNTRNTIAALLSISDGAGREEIVAATSSVLEAIDGVVALLALRRVDDLRRVTA